MSLRSGEGRVSLFVELGASFWLVVAAAFIGFVGIGATVPTLPPYVRHELGASNLVLGLLIGVFSVAGLAARLGLSRLADVRGRRFTLAVGLALGALGGLFYAVSLGVPGVAVGRIVHGAGEALVYIGAVAWVVDRAPPERRAQTLALLGSAVWGGLALGPLVGEALGSFVAAGWFVAITPLVGLATLRYVPESPVRRNPGRRTPVLPRASIGPGIALGLTNISYVALAGFLVLYLAGHGGGGAAAFAVFAGIVLASRILVGWLPDRVGPRRSLAIGHGLMAGGLAVIALFPSPAVAIAAAVAIGVGYSLPWPSIASFVLGQAPPDERGASVAGLTAFFDLFVGVGGFLAGGIAALFGYEAVFWLGVGCVGLSSLVVRSVIVEAPARLTPAPAEAGACSG
ncbi:MAG: MFS transporter [Gaiellales bacterium]